MTITVRRVKFEFPDDVDDVFPGDDPVGECARVAFSLTLPHLEPYLIRVYRSALGQITDDRLKADVEAFIGQEAQHHRNHSRVNDIIKGRLESTFAAKLQSIEDELEADYRRFTDTKSLRYNLVYAEGFEAMTCAWALTVFELAAEPGGMPARFGPWQQLWAWHSAEEIEHRTVAFEVYEQLYGKYPYRVAGSLRSQRHFLRYIDRLQKVLLAANGLPTRTPVSQLVRNSRYRRTFLPGYHPRDLTISPLVEVVLSQFRSSGDHS